MPSFRKTKETLLKVLTKSSWEKDFTNILRETDNPSELVSPLLSFVLRHEVRWQSIACFGPVLSAIAEKDKEKARVIMRRLMWSMNEESGNIGWGIPECMGSVFANNQFLAEEYAKILYSYAIDRGDDDNFIEHEPLRLGVYWGVAECAWKLPHMLTKSLDIFNYALDEESKAANILGCFGLLRLMQVQDMLENAKPLPAFKDCMHKVSNLMKQADYESEIFSKGTNATYTIHDLCSSILDLAGKTP